MPLLPSVRARIRASTPAATRSRRRPRAALASLALLVLVQACGLLDGGRPPAPVEPRPPGGSQPQRPPVITPQRPTEPTRPDGGSLPGQGSRPGTTGSGNISINGSCSQTEEDGYREQATLRVVDNQVQAMAWQLWVGKKGSCKFDLADFAQTKVRPSIELTARDGSGCKLVIYSDPRRITLGFADCQRRCTGNIYDEAYPVMFDPRSGGCADLSR